MPILFQTLAELCEKLESTTKRKAMANWVASFILQLEAGEIEPVISMLLGRVFPKCDQRVLEISWTTISTTIRKITNINNSMFSHAFGKTGDLGDVTKIIFEEGKIRKQAMLFQRQLTVLEVQRTFEAIAQASGTGSREKKERLLETLLSSATPLEAKYIVKVLIGEMRTGFNEGLMELAVAQAFNIPLGVIQKASMLMGDISKVATIAKFKGKRGLLKLQFKVFRPIKPMLAQTSETVAAALHEHGGQTALEYKLDGARIQIHKSGDVVKIFSRRLTDVTESLPEIIELIQNEVKADQAILEGEVIAVGKNGVPMPFQHLMRRFRRIRKIELATEVIPVQLCLFEVLYINGQSFINETYMQRRKKLTDVAGTIPLTKQIIPKNVEVAKEFLKEAIEAGHEGLMAKKVDSLYTPGVRGKGWLKIKTVLEPLDLVIVAAEYGYGRRHGWLSNYYLAARDTETGELFIVGKTFKGLTNAEIIWMTKRLKELIIKKERYKIIVAPKIVVEIAYNEIQTADSIQRVREIYKRQFEKKSNIKSI